eukprot:COSAG04_NODE_559_length_12608_cov_12.306499_4_plen_77_part_00
MYYLTPLIVLCCDQVLYNCIQQGEAVITLDIPLAMSNEPLSVSWTKKCGGIARQFFTVSTFDKVTNSRINSILIRF